MSTSGKTDIDWTDIDYVFIDNGGVMTDNSARSSVYRKLVGEYFVPRYGRTHAAWREANMLAFPKAWARFLERVSGWNGEIHIARAVWLYEADWLRFMFAAMGLPCPEDDDDCAAIAHAADRWINPQIVTLYPGVEDAIHLLQSRYALFTASDGFSEPLQETLRPVAASFGALYGPDIVNVPKSAGRHYYDAIFAHASVDPSRSLVLDDSLANIAAASEAGAHTIYVGSKPDRGYRGPSIRTLSDIIPLIEESRGL